MPSHSPKTPFTDRLRRVRRRLALKNGLVAAAVALGLLGLLAAGVIGFMNYNRFGDEVVNGARLVFYGGALFALVALFLPLLKRRSDRDTARLVEAEHQDLDALMVSAVEVMEDPSTENGGLGQRVLDQAKHQFDRRNVVAHLGRQTIRRSAVAITALIAIMAAAVMFGPDKLRYGAGLLFPSSEAHVDANPYAITVTPGNADLLSGEDQNIRATSSGFIPKQVTLFTRDLNADGTPTAEWA
ncbi:MAG: hypothetical protein AAF493_15990, partial [Pseudomonadota bacterium]